MTVRDRRSPGRPPLEGQRVLVTGGAGFLGAHLVRALIGSRAEVHVALRPGSSSWRLGPELASLTVHAADLVDPGAVSRICRTIRPAFVVHLARPHPRAGQTLPELVQGHVLTTAHLLEALRSLRSTRLVFASSFTVYGPASRPVRESDPPRPATMYGMSKVAAELLCLAAHRLWGLPATVLRLSTVYGPDDSPDRFVPTCIRAALAGSLIDLTAPGLRRDYVFVGDVVAAIVAAATESRAVGQTINVATGRDCANEEIAGLVVESTGSGSPLRIGTVPARPHDRSCWAGSVAKAARLMGWSARHTIREGLGLTIDHTREAGRRAPPGPGA